MRSAAHGRQDEAIPEPPPRDLAADTAALLDRAGTLMGRLEAGEAGTRLIGEMVVMSVQFGDLTAALEDAAAGESVVEAVGRAEYARGWNDRDAAGQRAPGPRHAARGRHLRLAGGAAVKASAVAAVAATATTMIAAHDSASVHHVALPRPAAVRVHGRPDSAVLVPQARWSPSPRPSMAAATASPVPAVTPSAPAPSSPPPVPSASPPPPVTVPAGPVLVAPGLLDLGGSHFGHLPLSVDGPGEVAWTATTADGITLVPSAGVVVSGQPVEIQVNDPAGNGGWVYLWAGSQALAVHVMPFGAPAVALP